MAALLADGFHGDDRRPVVGSSVRSGTDGQIADLRVIAELWGGEATSTVIATRGSRLALLRLEFSASDSGSEAFVTDMLAIEEIDDQERIVANVVFDSGDLDSAFAELDARYTAGETAPYADT